ncbi:hypothetical protein LYZ37_06070 [Vibrio tubiashii]|uniref:hypothetical protein n=1 Tax=Vibrio tubiashii TaxID=29498 RepID=UPI00234F25EE|nr:hypothetical protein [Vibrio tubiashii]WCP68284.1 hypothetical protein LYZ37_06070 [Vibrio tubiashii]
MKGAETSAPPSRHWVALYTFIILLPLVYAIPPFVVENISDNKEVVTFVSVAIIVPLVSYLFLPLAIKLHSAVRS